MTDRDDLGARRVVLVADPDAEPEAGTVTPPEEARISPLDRGFLYGDAAFETLRCYDGEPAFLDAHVDRLRETLSALSIPAEVTVEGMRRRVERLVSAVASEGTTDAYVRVSVTRGDREGLLAPTETTPRLVATAAPLSRRRYPPATVAVVDQRRYDAPQYRLKTHNYLPSVLARAEASDADEALMRGPDGGVVSGAVSNVFAVRDGRLRTPDEAVRPGVTRAVVRAVAADLGIDTEVGPLADLASADAAFLTNSTWGVRPVGAVEGTALPADDDRVAALADAYLERALP